MARRIHRLSARTVATLTKSGYHADGGGLYLQVGASGSKSWIFRFTFNSRSREMGLGSLMALSLAEARERAQACRKQVLERIDPIEQRLTARQEARLAATSAMTFQACAESYIAAHRAGWRNPKHRVQWESTLATYAYPSLGALPVPAIDTGFVMRVLEPIWLDKTETASRVRGRIEAVLDWAAARGYRQGDNPARWRGHLDQLLPGRAKVQRVTHHPALHYAEVGGFIVALHDRPGVASRALEFQILTAARTGEVIGATWQEIDVGQGIWTVPGSRMKAGREHRVPLSDRALAILAETRRVVQCPYIFPGLRADRPLSNMAFLQLLKRMGRSDITAHGFRSSFRDWAAEQTNHSREAAEMALAHTLTDKVEAAYRRGDLFEKRRRLMQDWADCCSAALRAQEHVRRAFAE